jgi:hypothetical protein
MQTIQPEHKTYFVCHDGDKVFHFGMVEAGKQVSTGQPYIRQHDTEEQLAASVNELTGIPNYYQAKQYGELYLLADINDRYMKPVFDLQDGEELQDAPFTIETHKLFRWDKNIGAWVEGVISDGEWKIKTD